MSAISPTTQRAEEIRELTGCAWEIACQRAENERDDGRQLFPVENGPEKRGGATRKVRGSDLRVGDILFFLGHPHRLTHFDAYTGPFDFIERIACSGDADNPHCWGMSLEANAHYHIA